MTSRKMWPEIDTLRGFGIILMILNHVGVRWLDPQITNGLVTDALVYIGSYAPVVFFFVTGVGYGVSHDPANRSRRHSDVVYKAGLLLLADVFMRGDGFAVIGLDFLGFIGLCMLTLHFGCSGRHGKLIALLILFSSVGIRFGLGPMYRWTGQEVFWLHSLLGNTGVPGFSYWIVPWLAYPVLGFLFGGMLRRQEVRERRCFGIISPLLLLGMGTGITAGFLAWRGTEFSRYGTISAAFFVSTIALLAFATALAWLLCASMRFPSVGSLLAMRGVSSFVVVPIHIFLIVFLGQWSSLPLSGGLYLIVVFPFIAANYFASKFADRVAQQFGTKMPVGTHRWYAAGAVLIVLAVIVTIVHQNMLALVLATAAQLIIAVLLTIRPVEKSPMRGGTIASSSKVRLGGRLRGLGSQPLMLAQNSPKASSLRFATTTRAGTPAATLRSGTDSNTTALAAITHFEPTVTGPSICDPTVAIT